MRQKYGICATEGLSHQRAEPSKPREGWGGSGVDPVPKQWLGIGALARWVHMLPSLSWIMRPFCSLQDFNST